MSRRNDHEPEEAFDIALVGELHENESEVTQELLRVPERGECSLYINSPGGSQYSALSLMSIILLRRLKATAIVTGECSSAAIWPFAACRSRRVTPYSVFLFHPMRWESEENIVIREAAEWTRHFESLEEEMQQLLAKHLGIDRKLLDRWTDASRYVSAQELVDQGVAQLCWPGGKSATS